MNFVSTLGWLGNKLEKFWEWFKSFIDKYIGSGFPAMIVTLVLIIVAIIVIRKFTSK